MAAKSRDLTESDQKQYVESYKHLFKRMNFNGTEYLEIFKNAVEQYTTHKREAEVLFETKKNVYVLWKINGVVLYGLDGIQMDLLNTFSIGLG